MNFTCNNLKQAKLLQRTANIINHDIKQLTASAPPQRFPLYRVYSKRFVRSFTQETSYFFYARNVELTEIENDLILRDPEMWWDESKRERVFVIQFECQDLIPFLERRIEYKYIGEQLVSIILVDEEDSECNIHVKPRNFLEQGDDRENEMLNILIIEELFRKKIDYYLTHFVNPMVRKETEPNRW